MYLAVVCMSSFSIHCSTPNKSLSSVSFESTLEWKRKRTVRWRQLICSGIIEKRALVTTICWCVCALHDAHDQSLDSYHLELSLRDPKYFNNPDISCEDLFVCIKYIEIVSFIEWFLNKWRANDTSWGCPHSPEFKITRAVARYSFPTSP